MTPAGGALGGPDPDVCTLAVPDDTVDGEWEALALTVGAPPFLRPGWVRAWMAAFAPRRPLRLLTVRRGGDLVALLPVLTGIRGMVSPVNNETPVMQPLAVDDRALAAMVPGLLSRGPRADLRLVPDDDRARALVAEAQAQGFSSSREVVRRSPYTRVDGEWESFQRSVLSRSRRKSLRRLDEKLRARGKVDFEVHDGDRDRAALLDEGLGLELAGWKGQRGIAVLSRPQTARFYRSVAEWAAREGILRLCFLRLDGRAVAFGYRLEQQGVVYSLKIAHAEEFREYGPGLLLKQHFLADDFRRPDVHLIDWLPGATPHKLLFASGVRPLLRLQFFSRGAVGGLERGLAAALTTAHDQARQRLSEDRRTQIRRALGIDRARAPAPTEPSVPRDGGMA